MNSVDCLSFCDDSLALPEFHTKAGRMGKVARVSDARVEFWQAGDMSLHELWWS
jgi:hypothetical protein